VEQGRHFWYDSLKKKTPGWQFSMHLLLDFKENPSSHFKHLVRVQYLQFKGQETHFVLSEERVKLGEHLKHSELLKQSSQFGSGQDTHLFFILQNPGKQRKHFVGEHERQLEEQGRHLFNLGSK
jgi:hypothetical protein